VEKGNEWKVYINGGFPANNRVRDTGLLSALVGISSAVIYVDDGNIEGVCKSDFKVSTLDVGPRLSNKMLQLLLGASLIGTDTIHSLDHLSQ